MLPTECLCEMMSKWWVMSDHWDGRHQLRQKTQQTCDSQEQDQNWRCWGQRWASDIYGNFLCKIFIIHLLPFNIFLISIINYCEKVTWLWRWRMTRSSWPMLTSPSWIFWRGSSRDMCRCPERAGCGRWVFRRVVFVSLNKECISDDLLLQDEWGRKTHNDTGWLLV